MQDNNPDGSLAVRFYSKEVDMSFASEQAGRPIKAMADYVRIEVPGDMTSIIDTVANADHKTRFPIQWAQYQNEKGDGGQQVQGTLLRDWPLLTPAQASELKHFKFYTVEQVSAASDQQIGAIGMLVGMSGFSFRDKAKAFLAQATDSALSMKQAEQLRQRDEEIEALKAKDLQRDKDMAEMREQMAELTKGKKSRKAEEAQA